MQADPAKKHNFELFRIECLFNLDGFESLVQVLDLLDVAFDATPPEKTTPD